MLTRRASRIVCAALLAGLTIGVANPAMAVPSKDRFALGDSVMLGARTALKETGFAVDATESRQAYAGPALLRKRGDRLPTNVVVHLGTNGTFPLETCKAMVKAAGPDRRVFFVTVHVPRSWEKSNNDVIRQCDAEFAPDRVHVIDWDKAASQHPGWFYGDGIHLKPSGGAGFAQLLDSAVNDAVARARATALANASGSGKAGLDG